MEQAVRSTVGSIFFAKNVAEASQGANGSIFLCYNVSMDIALMVLGAIIIILLVVLIFKKPKVEVNSDFKSMEERLIRVEGEVGKINPAIDRNFRENRKEIAENLERMQNGNEKKLEEMRETVDEKLKASVEKRFNESFKTISTQLNQVSQGLGEMKTMATEV